MNSQKRQFWQTKVSLLILITLVLLIDAARGALPIFPAGDANIVLGDPLKRITQSLPDIKSMCGTDQNGVFIEAYVTENPAFIDAKKIWFFLDRHKLFRIDYIFTEAQFSRIDQGEPVRSLLTRYFGEQGKNKRIDPDYEDVSKSLVWSDYNTGEEASIDYLKQGDVRVSFFNARLKKDTTESLPEALNRPPPRGEDSTSLIPDGTAGEVGLALQRNRPPNGTIFIQTSTQGNGELTIQNGTKWDAQVKLVSPTRKYIFISVYIHSGKSAKVTNIRANTYKLIYALGEGWDENRNRMFRISYTASFERLLTFERSSEHHSTYRVTLHPVEEGNANSRPISEDDFFAY